MNELNEDLLLAIALIGLVGFFVVVYWVFGRTYECRRCHYPIHRSETRCPNCGWDSERGRTSRR
jgi:anaerobic ribonucleoside-triphosphate reductase